MKVIKKRIKVNTAHASSVSSQFISPGKESEWNPFQLKKRFSYLDVSFGNGWHLKEYNSCPYYFWPVYNPFISKIYFTFPLSDREEGVVKQGG